MKPRKLYWSPTRTPKELHFLLKELGKDYSLAPSEKANLHFQRTDAPLEYSITLQDGKQLISYGEKALAVRAITSLLSGLVGKSEYREIRPLSVQGMLIDCSRGFVPRVEYLKKWIRWLAMMGFNMLQLYTEDAYEIKGEEYFGYLRGKFTYKELKALNQYGNRFGVEMVGCIQTLTHMEKALRWSVYDDIKSTYHMPLIDEPKTYQLIEKMIQTYAKCYSSRRINVGMDEGADLNDGLGTGKYRKLHGKKDRAEIFSRHINKVAAICKKHGLEPWFWGDTPFRIGSKYGGYVDDKQAKVSAGLLREFPKNMQPIYWDYDRTNSAHYEHWIDRHKIFGSMPVMAPAVHTWSSFFWHCRESTEEAIPYSIAACRKKGVDKMLICSWSTSSAACGMDSWLAGYSFAAEHIFQGKADNAVLNKRFAALCDRSYDDYTKISDMYSNVKTPGRGTLLNIVVYDDPLLGTMWKNTHARHPRHWASEAKRLAEHRRILGSLKLNHEDLKYAFRICDLFQVTIEFRLGMYSAYKKKDRNALRKLAATLPEIVRKLEQFRDMSRKMWLDRHKPYGLEIIQIRFSALAARYEETRKRLLEFADRKVDSIPEIEEFPKQPVNIGYYAYDGVLATSMGGL